MILRLTYADFGGYGEGWSSPVFYEQNSATDDWIGGPNIAFVGIDFSAGAGENGSGGSTPIFSGGFTDGLEYVRLLDDGAEWSDSQWTVDFNGGDAKTYAAYAVCPMGCTKHTISTQYTNLDTPSYCVDLLCTIVRWTDA